MISLTQFHEQRAASCLRRGGIVAHATEGVWGLACDASNDEAVLQLIELKGRSVTQGLIVALDKADSAMPALQGLDKNRRTQVMASWPGHTTWLVPDCQDLPISDLVRGDSGRIALRVPDHDQTRRVIEFAGVPIVSTSANPSGCPPARSALRVRMYFGNAFDMLLPGTLGSARGPSEVRDAVTGEVLRPAIQGSS